ncbi:hypothetical protein BGZ97_001038 [Linnemannia gamsii]|jgi:hypothetical protein|uniref:Uncharacterized protein n=1 Tax=Linnemannia gamsii TaxID=64522 RepID=A0A9P6QX29_9FUNG|nr:hypothetical protein BGZ97_001038 [Linnemannia gamsii]
MKCAPLILATLAIAATSEAGRVYGSCKMEIIGVFDSKIMHCQATLPNGSTRTKSDGGHGQFPKICADDGSICWQMNTKVPENIDVFYANTVRQTTGSVSERSSDGLQWRTTYDVNF